MFRAQFIEHAEPIHLF